jgi:chemotaxis protein CheC
MDVLNEIQSDVLTETFNLGMGAAAAALSEMVEEEVALSVPELLFMTKAQAAEVIAAQTIKTVTGVSQDFKGSVGGQAMLLFPGQKSLELVRLLLKDTVPINQLTEFEEEALSEIGNIIINGGLASLADMFGEEIISELPMFIQGTSTDILDVNVKSIGVADIILFLRVDFFVEKYEIDGYIAIILDVKSVQDLTQNIDNYLKRIGVIK